MPVLLAGVFMIVLDFFIVNVALPSIRTGLHAGATTLEWVVAGYGLTFAVLLTTAGRLGDRMGRRRMLGAGMALFTAASAGCGLATSASMLVTLRCVQGVGAALISPTVLSLIGVLFTGEHRARAISLYGAVMGLAAAGGQLIGGVLIAADPAGLGWRSIFLINAPIGLLALVAGSKAIPESKAAATGSVDLAGITILTMGLVALVLPLVQGRQLGWPGWTWGTLAAAPVLIAGFVVHQRARTRAGSVPLVDVGRLTRRPLGAGLATQLAFWSGQASFFVVLALYLQWGRGIGPLESGSVFTITAAAYLATSVRAPSLTLRHGRTVIGIGALTLAVGHAALSVAALGAAPLGLLAPGLVLVGAGMGLCITPLTTVILGCAEPDVAGMVSGALSTTQQIGNCIGVAVTGVIFFGAVRHGYGHAFAFSELELAIVTVGVAALSRLLPGGPAHTPANPDQARRPADGARRAPSTVPTGNEVEGWPA
jgi:MFS family permease